MVACNNQFIITANKSIALFLTDASSSNEAVHLQQRLKSLSTELVTLRNRLHVGQAAAGAGIVAGGVGPNNAIPSPNNSNLLTGPNNDSNTVIFALLNSIATYKLILNNFPVPSSTLHFTNFK